MAKSKEIRPIYDLVYPKLGSNGKIKKNFLVLVVVMLLWEEHSMLKCSHFEKYISYNIIKKYLKELKSKEIRPTFVPTYPPLGTNGR